LLHALEAGKVVRVSSCEEPSYPYRTHPESFHEGWIRPAKRRKEWGVAIVGTAVEYGIAMTSWRLRWGQCAQRIDRKCEGAADCGTRSKRSLPRSEKDWRGTERGEFRAASERGTIKQLADRSPVRCSGSLDWPGTKYRKRSSRKWATEKVTNGNSDGSRWDTSGGRLSPDCARGVRGKEVIYMEMQTVRGAKRSHRLDYAERGIEIRS